MNKNLEYTFCVTTYATNGEWGTFTVRLADLVDKNTFPAIQREAMCGVLCGERDKLDRAADRRWEDWKARGAAWPRTEEVLAAERRLHALWDEMRYQPAFSAYDPRVRIIHEARGALAALARMALCDALEAAAQAR